VKANKKMAGFVQGNVEGGGGQNNKAIIARAYTTHVRKYFVLDMPGKEILALLY